MPFQFTLTPADTERNRQLRSYYNEENIVVFAGLVLAVQSITPRQPRFETRSKTWLSKVDLGQSSKTKVVNTTDADGRKKKIETTTETLDDGTVVVRTVETVFGTSLKLVSQSTTEDIITATDQGVFDQARATTKVTTTKVTPKDSEVSFVSEVTEVVNTDANTTNSHEVKRVEQQEPVEQQQPVTVKSITGKIVNQFFTPIPPQGRDVYYWNDEMLQTEKTFEESISDNGDGTETVSRFEQETNKRGELTETTTTIVRDKEDDDSGSKITQTTRTPRQETVVEKTFDTDGVLTSTRTVTTSQFDSVEGGTSSIVVESVEESEDSDGKKITKTTISQTDAETGVTETVETEEITDPGKPLIQFNRSITENILTGEREIRETTTTTDGYGNSVTDEKVYKDYNQKTTTTLERTQDADELEDDIIDDLVNGFLISEYELSGQLITSDQAFRIMNLHHDHQTAWAFMNVLDDQLSRSDKLSPAKRKELYRQWQTCFLGEESQVRGGPTLSRIDMDAFGENNLEVVFAPSPGSFRIDWINGTDGLYSWSMTVRAYSSIVREKSTSYLAKPEFGGRYGRSDGQHWTGQTNSDQLRASFDYDAYMEGFRDLWQFD